MYKLTAPINSGYHMWKATLEEFGDGPIDGSGYFENHPPIDLSQDGFLHYLNDRAAAADPAVPPPENFVHCTYYWILNDDDVLVGFLALRHTLNQHLLEVGGHIGYSVRPSARQKGAATAALKLGVQEARAMGIDKVLVCVKEDNVASRTVIERCGGIFESTIRGLRRYWINTIHA
ncbi:acetyltransferase [Corynebacterium suranareeae]|uniref:Acetyltransferase n=1 Tax=Corynebacterium suranareeae TaxID=2506452 RepID=A0A160PMG6_9CORY|nr:GNAT family N-acetyltransferase [Corynebacterium suranareeae]BAU94939.1 acetyltransferase [Corynebacterium suranareeae]